MLNNRFLPILQAAATGVMFVAASTRAEVADCLSEGNSFKVFLDDVATTSTASTDGMGPWLAWHLQTTLDALALEEGTIQVVRCGNRRPQPSDFDSTLVQRLHQRYVLLELWGQLLEKEALVGYALISILNRKATAVRAIYTVRRPKRRERLVDDKTVKAYALLSLGVKLLDTALASPKETERSRSFDLAYKYLCRATFFFPKSPDLEWQALSVYAQQLVRQVKHNAVQDQDYKGVLKLVTSNPSLCGETP